MKISPGMSVGAVVTERLGRARVFERLGIDYCCQGLTTLAAACEKRSLDLNRVLAELAEGDAEPTLEGDDHVDFAAMSERDLVDHIIGTHHVFLRRELPRLAALIEKVVSAHAMKLPELNVLRDTFTGLHQELETHMMKEEMVLFPLVKQLEGATDRFPIRCSTVENPIRVMVHEHAAVGSDLERIRNLTADFQPPENSCVSFRALYDGLARLEWDLHRHIHKENNILFPRAAALEAALVVAGA